MSNDIKVAPTPIQRNHLDVATELTQLYYQNKNIGSLDEISEVFAKFFSLVVLCEITYREDLKNLLPDGLKSKLFTQK